MAPRSDSSAEFVPVRSIPEVFDEGALVVGSLQCSFTSGTGRFEGAGNRDSAQTVAVGLHHGEERRGDQGLEMAGIAKERREIHLEPGPIRNGRI